MKYTFCDSSYRTASGWLSPSTEKRMEVESCTVSKSAVMDCFFSGVVQDIAVKKASIAKENNFMSHFLS
jgi:hypothetical protein